MVGEILNINNEYKSYEEYKRTLDGKFKEQAEGFVEIGYLLKVARDTDILKKSGYSNMNDFAQAEYGLDKSQVSRYIRINDNFSEGGYSKQLQKRVQGFGYSKLAIMMMLPEYINDELTPTLSKTDILAVKEEVEAEQKISDLEVLMEEKDQGQQSYGIFAKVLHQLGRDNPDLYLELYDAVENTAYDGSNRPVIVKLANALAPAGEGIHSVRIAGEGRKLLSIKGEEREPTITDIRSGEKGACPWDDFIQDMESLCVSTDAKESWEKLYGEAFPEEEKKGDTVPESRKTTKVHKAREAKKNERPVERPKTEAEPENQKEHGPEDSSTEKEDKPEGQSGKEEESGSTADHKEQQPVQMRVEDYPEMLPENYKVAPVQPTIQGKLVKESMCLGVFKEEMDSAYTMADKREYEQAKVHLVRAGELLDRLQKFMEVEDSNGEETA